MSNIYIQEPPTSGKVLLKTSVGDIDIELWSKECPKTCRNFIQLCMEGYYNGTIFHRVVKGFIAQGGDPNGDGTGGESIYGKPFKDEFHSRLRYTRRGLVGMANSESNDNGSQFFFTFGATPELQNKNTLFGKVTGDTIYNMLKLEDGLIDHNEKPMYPQRIISTEVLTNPFDDIVPRVLKPKGEKKAKRAKREKGVKNFGLLSFGEEAEDDEQEVNKFVYQNVGKSKSIHDNVDDPKLSKEVLQVKDVPDEDYLSDDCAAELQEQESDSEKRKERIKEKLTSKRGKTTKTEKEELSKKPKIEDCDDSDEDVLMTQEHERKLHTEKRKAEIREEILSLKRSYKSNKKKNDELLEPNVQKPTSSDKIRNVAEDNELIQHFIEVKEKYSSKKSEISMKGPSREDFTLSLLKKFRTKLDALKQKHSEDESSQTVKKKIDDKALEQEIQSDNWLAHTLRFEDSAPVLAKDASTKNDDWYDAYDPRNPLNKRKRGEHGKSKTRN